MKNKNKMEKILSNQEFNNLLKDIKIEQVDFRGALVRDVPKSIDEVLAKLKIYWKVIKPILKIVKLITPRKIDKAIDEFIAIVDKLLQETDEQAQSELLDRFAVVWGIVRPGLVAAKAITPPKADAIIDEVIKIGDLLASS